MIIPNSHVSPALVPPASTKEEREASLVNECISETRTLLKNALSIVVVTEMSHVYGDLWQEIVLVKPPYESVGQILTCMCKHFVAVFGMFMHRQLKDNLVRLEEYFRSPGMFAFCVSVLTIMSMLASQPYCLKHCIITKCDVYCNALYFSMIQGSSVVSSLHEYGISLYVYRKLYFLPAYRLCLQTALFCTYIYIIYSSVVPCDKHLLPVE